MATTALFTASDLNALPGITGVTDAEATAVEAVVWGWLQPLLKVTDRPDPVPPNLFSWALELGVIYRSNPEGLKSYSLDTESSTYDHDRIDAILRTAAGGGAVAPGAAPAPSFSFPSARRYPDPAERCW